MQNWISLAMVGGALVIGLLVSPLMGAIIAAGACVPAGYAFWKGTQDETQTKSAMAIGSLFVAGLASTGLLIWQVVRWVF